MKLILALLGIFILSSCVQHLDEPALNEFPDPIDKSVELVILGTVQDAGSPQISCQKPCCRDLFDHPDASRKVVSLGVIDYIAREKYMFEATPDFPSQVRALHTSSQFDQELPNGIFLTHAHIGHYTGLMHLGKEAMNATNVPVYAMPKMQEFLKKNGPWSQLISSNNIELKLLKHLKAVELTPQLSVTPFTVPHRDEYSETVGYTIDGPNKRALFIPDIDKWDKWEQDIIEVINSVDYAFIDATFFSEKEINNRDISEIPHPFVIESMKLFRDLPKEEKAKIYFIHFNHTNPLLNPTSRAIKRIERNGFKIARIGEVLTL